MEAMAIAVRLRATRRLGEILMADGRRPERPKKVGGGKVSPSLKELGISKDLSAKAKSYARWDREDFERALAKLEAGIAARTHRPTTDLLRFKLDAEPEPEAPEGKYEAVIVDPDWTEVPRDHTIPAPPIWRDGCHVFLWTKPQDLPRALATNATWKAKYCCLFVWKPTGENRIELIIYARAGSPTFKETKRFACAFEAPGDRPDGRPSQFYDTIERVCKGPIGEFSGSNPNQSPGRAQTR